MIAAQLQAEDNFMPPTVNVHAQAPRANPNARTPEGKPLLGVTFGNMPLRTPWWCKVSTANTPADAAGILRGDMILRYNGQIVTDVDEFDNLISQTVPGTLVPLEISRGLMQAEHIGADVAPALPSRLNSR